MADSIALEDGVIHVRMSGREEYELEITVQQEGTRGIRSSRHKVVVAAGTTPVYAKGDVDWDERAAFDDGTIDVQVRTREGDILLEGSLDRG